MATYKPKPICGVFIAALFCSALISAGRGGAQELNVQINVWALQDYPQHLDYQICNGSNTAIDVFELSSLNIRPDSSWIQSPPGWGAAQHSEDSMAWLADDGYEVQSGQCL